MAFSFQKLDVYQKALELVYDVEELCRSLKGRATFSMLDQLSRATFSIPLNIAEGSGRWHKPEKKQFLRIAQGSVFETVPIFDVFLKRGLITSEEYNQFFSKIDSLSRMLTMLIKSIDTLQR